jgi:hypothetical protein
MAFSNLNAPITNPAASKRIADTQALRARSLVAQGANAAQAGAQLTQGGGQAALQEQSNQAGLAKAQTSNVMQKQNQAAAKTLFNREQEQTQEERLLNDSLFNINQNAAQEDADIRNAFANQQAQTKYLQEQQLADWAVLNAENEQDFKDKLLTMDQAHSKAMSFQAHAFKLVEQELREEFKTASAERQQELRTELLQIQNAWAEEERKAKAKAANRQAMIGAGSMILGAGVAAIATGLTAGAAAPFAPAIMAGTSAVLQGSGATESLGDSTGAI